MNAPTGYLVRERWRTWANAVVVGLAGLLVLELMFHLVAAPNMRVQKVEIHGAKPVDDAELLKLLGLRDREYYFSLSETDLETRLKDLPWVQSAQVAKVFPDKVVIDLKPRQALALSIAGSSVMAIDADGVVFDVRQTAGWDLPIVSGLTFQSREPGSRLPDKLVPLFRQLKDLQDGSPALFRMLSEVEVKKNDRGSFDVVLYPAHTPVRVLLGDRWDAQVLQQMFVLLDLVKKQGWTGKTKEIDFRATPVVLRSGES